MFAWSFLAKVFWIYFGLLFRALGNRFGWGDSYGSAVRCFSRAMAHDPGDAHLYFWRGTLRWREFGDVAGAEADLTRAIELDPHLTRAYLNRGLARWYTLPPDRAGATADFRAFLECSGEPYWRGVVEELLGRAAGPSDHEAMGNHQDTETAMGEAATEHQGAEAWRGELGADRQYTGARTGEAATDDGATETRG